VFLTDTKRPSEQRRQHEDLKVLQIHAGGSDRYISHGPVCVMKNAPSSSPVLTGLENPESVTTEQTHRRLRETLHIPREEL